ncbi:MAG: RpiB/LacA/LacB family sugar-phosphate isomerase [Oscillospiraceae bacterium]|nr:RpiB/LacA/LacB family sugar-phosphate isomerase [Oscillospiraceae bacterium]
MKIAIGSDKSGFPVKEAVNSRLHDNGYDFTDLEQVHPYYQVAGDVAPLVQNGTYDRAVLICDTGAGMCVVSNKFKGVGAALILRRGKLNREGKQESRGKRPQTLPSAFLFFRPQPAAGAGREAYSFTVNTTVSSPSMRALMLPL